MNASALLRGQGWRGDGHSLDHTGRGIKKPLLISHKQDLLGLGKKKPAHNVSDQWWMRAFDESLKGFGSGQTSTLSQVRETGISRSGLYGFFVKGEGLIGTITEESLATEASNTSYATSGASTPPTTPSENSEDMSGESGSFVTSDCEPAIREPPAFNPRKRQRENGPSKADTKRRKHEEKLGKREESEVAKTSPTTLSVSNGNAIDSDAGSSTAIVRTIIAEINRKAEKQSRLASKGAQHEAKVGANGKERKSSKLARERARREKKRALRIKMTAEAMDRGDLPNPENVSPQQFLEKFDKMEKQESKAARQEKHKGKLEEHQTRKTEKEEKKQIKQAEKAARREKQRAEECQASATGTEQLLESGQNFEANADMITLEPTVQKSKYPSKREKRNRKEAAQAQAQGISVEELQANIERARLLNIELERKKKAIEAKQKALTPEERQQYTDRASLKGMTIEDYIARRIEKKRIKKAKTVLSKTEEAKSEGTNSEAIGFVVDTRGDPTILAKAALPNAEPLPLDPTIWEGRQVKSLTKAERKARLEWLRERRRQRKIGKGLNPVTNAERSRAREYNRMQKRRMRAQEIMKEEGKTIGQTTKEERRQFSRMARSALKKEKKLKKKEGKGGRGRGRKRELNKKGGISS